MRFSQTVCLVNNFYCLPLYWQVINGISKASDSAEERNVAFIKPAL
jgi:hypothetical protein